MFKLIFALALTAGFAYLVAEFVKMLQAILL